MNATVFAASSGRRRHRESVPRANRLRPSVRSGASGAGTNAHGDAFTEADAGRQDSRGLHLTIPFSTTSGEERARLLNRRYARDLMGIARCVSSRVRVCEYICLHRTSSTPTSRGKGRSRDDRALCVVRQSPVGDRALIPCLSDPSNEGFSSASTKSACSNGSKRTGFTRKGGNGSASGGASSRIRMMHADEKSASTLLDGIEGMRSVPARLPDVTRCCTDGHHLLALASMSA